MPGVPACPICGHDRVVHADVLWPALIAAWDLEPDEVDYINVQQGTRCERCGGNVRSQALAQGLLRVLGWPGTLESYVAQSGCSGPRLLEINEAGTLTPWLARLPGHRLARHPDVDLARLPFDTHAFDLVVHSDTLEHVAEPMTALAECARVVAPGGACVFTVPVRVARQTRSRQGLPPSYHGNSGCRQEDLLVHTEYGSDIWTDVLRAGFDSCEMVGYRFPAGLAIVGRRAARPRER